MVIWTDTAIRHITEFIDEANKGTETIAKEYMRKLVDYVAILEIMSEIGKKLDFILNYEIKQIIYRKHRILYHIKGRDIVILSVLHTRVDMNKVLNSIIKEIN